MDRRRTVIGFVALAECPAPSWRTLRARQDLGSASGFYPATACRKCRGSGMLKPAIDRPSSDPDGATVVKTVAVASSRFNKAQQADL